MLTFVMKGTVGGLSRPLNRGRWRMCAVQFLILSEALKGCRNEGWEVISKKEHERLSVSLSPPQTRQVQINGPTEEAEEGCRMNS